MTVTDLDVVVLRKILVVYVRFIPTKAWTGDIFLVPGTATIERKLHKW